MASELAGKTIASLPAEGVELDAGLTSSRRADDLPTCCVKLAEGRHAEQAQSA